MIQVILIFVAIAIVAILLNKRTEVIKGERKGSSGKTPDLSPREEEELKDNGR